MPDKPRPQDCLWHTSGTGIVRVFRTCEGPKSGLSVLESPLLEVMLLHRVAQLRADATDCGRRGGRESNPHGVATSGFWVISTNQIRCIRYLVVLARSYATFSSSAPVAGLPFCQVHRSLASDVLADTIRSRSSPQSRCCLATADYWVGPRSAFGRDNSTHRWAG
jgi:hypothetical protein